MFPQPSFLRASQRVGVQIRTPTIRSNVQRRLASTNTPPPPLTGAADNAFNRERQAVKAHASATSDLWRKLSIYVTIPCLIIAGVNAYALWTEHWEHEAHLPPLEERPQYSYMNIRTKKFPWGDGDKLERQGKLPQEGVKEEESDQAKGMTSKDSKWTEVDEFIRNFETNNL